MHLTTWRRRLFVILSVLAKDLPGAPAPLGKAGAAPKFEARSFGSTLRMTSERAGVLGRLKMVVAVRRGSMRGRYGHAFTVASRPRFSLERHALRQRQIAGVVDGVGGAAHVV